MYKLTEQFRNLEAKKLITFLEGERINLTGKDIEVRIPASKSSPAMVETIKGATQDQLEQFYKLGKQNIIEKVEKPAKSKAEDKE